MIASGRIQPAEPAWQDAPLKIQCVPRQAGTDPKQTMTALLDQVDTNASSSFTSAVALLRILLQR